MGTFTKHQRNNPYSNTYNPGWAQHPNLSWRGNNSLNPPKITNPPPLKKDLEEVIAQYIQATNSQIEALSRNQI